MDRYNIPYLDRNEFYQIYMDLVYAVRILSKQGTKNLEEYLGKIMKRLVNYFNRAYKTDVKVGFTTIIPQKKVKRAPCRFNLNNGRIEFDIETFKNTMDEKKQKDSSGTYFDVTTFAIFLIDVVFHEFSHYLQIKHDGKNISEQNYINSLSFVMANYFEQSIEGDAYGLGVNMMYYFLSHEYIPKMDIELFNVHMNNRSFIGDKISQQLLIHWLCKIPFMTNYNSFSPITEIINKYLLSISKKDFDHIAIEFPLITLGVSTYGKEKNANEFVKQYVDRIIFFDGMNLGHLEDGDIDKITDIYTYLLIPKLSPFVYENLSQSYGADVIDTLMLQMKEKIDEKLKAYKEAYKESVFWYKKAGRQDLEDMNVDENYIHDKYKASINYLQKSIKIIDECLKAQSKYRR